MKLQLTEVERASAREVIETLLDEADALGHGLLARVWRTEAEQLAALCLVEPDETSAITCGCGAAATEIGPSGLPVCGACVVREKGVR